MKRFACFCCRVDTRRCSNRRSRGEWFSAPSMGFGPFWRIQYERSFFVSVCLSDTFHSQSFSLSQRFYPARTSRLCFIPHPPIGFWSSEFSPFNQPIHLSMFRPLVPLNRCLHLVVMRTCSSRFQSINPIERPCSSVGVSPFRRVDTLLTFSPLQGKPARIVGLLPSPLARSLRYCLQFMRRVLQGLDPIRLGVYYVSSLTLHEVFHLVQLSSIIHASYPEVVGVGEGGMEPLSPDTSCVERACSTRANR